MVKTKARSSNLREQHAIEKYESEGYDVIKTGIPDLTLLKDGKISFVEVKSFTDKLRKEQERSMRLLLKHGFNAKVERYHNYKGSMFTEKQYDIWCLENGYENPYKCTECGSYNINQRNHSFKFVCLDCGFCAQKQVGSRR